MRFPPGFALLCLLAFTGTATADEVIADDLVAQSSLCVGMDCVDGEEFGFDTLRLKSPGPRILFQDTSSSSSFPNQDWLVGASDEGMAVPASFFIRNITSSLTALVLTPQGDVSLGAGSEVVDGAVSVGSQGNERRVTFVADAVDDNDAVNLGQFNSFKTDALDTVDTEVAELDTRVGELESRLSDVADRIEAVAKRLR